MCTPEPERSEARGDLRTPDTDFGRSCRNKRSTGAEKSEFFETPGSSPPCRRRRKPGWALLGMGIRWWCAGRAGRVGATEDHNSIITSKGRGLGLGLGRWANQNGQSPHDNDRVFGTDATASRRQRAQAPVVFLGMMGYYAQLSSPPTRERCRSWRRDYETHPPISLLS